MLKTLLFGLLLTASLSANAFAQSTIFVVRHAERADTEPGAKPMTDPALSAAGRARAATLSRMLSDAGIGAVFVTEFKRTQETAAPLAKALGLTAATVSAKDTKALVAKLAALDTNALVVGHSNTVPEILSALGATPAVTLSDGDYDNLFIVIPGQPVTVVRLHY